MSGHQNAAAPKPAAQQSGAIPTAEPGVPIERPDAAAFLVKSPPAPSPYPKVKFHPVHGGVTVKDPVEEAGLHGWFDTPEEADMHRTWLDAELVRARNMAERLKAMGDKPVVQNSVQHDEAARRAAADAAVPPAAA